MSALADRRSSDRFRVRSLCMLEGDDGLVTGRLRDISATGAFLETSHRPRLGSAALLHHPAVGVHACEVARHALDGIAVSFALGEGAVRFALSVISAEMVAEDEAPRLVGLAGGR